ncbi:MAG TPA: FkbM family methyltransferase [Steroidobacteraceae bacterium]|jgi:FkbM family methyltransferase|nr:FkbM family methyltransferase [Steroidobacteraceae bacterium]
MTAPAPTDGNPGTLSAPPGPVEYPWAVRALRTVQFGFARLLSRDGYVTARAAPFGLTFTGPAADVITRHIYRLGAHEPAITRYLIEHLHLGAGEVALDVGANIGWYSILLQHLSEPGAQIFAFEPDPETYSLLRTNLRANAAERVTALNLALGDAPGTAQLRRYKHSNNGRHTLVVDGPAADMVPVAVDTLAAFWSAHALGSRPLRFLKIDVEGFEYFVLRGAGELLTRCANIFLEYSPASLRLAGLGPDVLIELLRAARLSARAFRGGQLVPMSLTELAQVQEQHDLLLVPQ